MPVAEVGVKEFHRASRLLVALSGIDPGRVGAETIRLDVPAEKRAWKADATGFAAVMAAKESALGVVRAKDRHQLTAEDALTIGEKDLPHLADTPRSFFFNTELRA